MSDDTPDRYLKLPVEARVGDGGHFKIGELVIDLEEISQQFPEQEAPSFIDAMKVTIQESQKQLPKMFRDFADMLETEDVPGQLGLT